MKLDELLRAVSEARTGLVDLEDMSDEELRRLQDQFQKLRDEVGAHRGEPRRAAPPPAIDQDANR